ncbi:MAG: ATP-binding cassette domain-containing protein, partial [Pseudomonadota bacterium]
MGSEQTCIAAPCMTAALLEVESLTTDLPSDRGLVRVVDGVSFTVENGATVGIAGESGCGKSVSALSIMRLVPPPGRIRANRLCFRGIDMLALSEKEIRRIRGNR